jgi:hypothetical protein
VESVLVVGCAVQRDQGKSRQNEGPGIGRDHPLTDGSQPHKLAFRLQGQAMLHRTLC